VRVCIPFWGVVEIERGGVSEYGVEDAGVGEGWEHRIVPELGAAGGVDDWAVHGVDMAFDNLARELEGPDVGGEEPWARWMDDGGS